MTNRAVAFAHHGDPSVLQLIDLPETHAGPSQVRVRMRAAGVQPFDCAFRRGDLQGFLPARFPQLLGNDFAGVVDEVGIEVTGIEVGEHVLGFCTLLAHAEMIVVDAHRCRAPAPDAALAGRGRAVGVRADRAERAARAGRPRR